MPDPGFPCLYCHGDRGGTSLRRPTPDRETRDRQETEERREQRGESSTSSKWEGFSHRSKEGKWVAEIRPSRPEWAKGGPGRPAWATGDLKIALGSYKTRKGAAMAYDVGIFYTGKPVRFNLCSPVGFVEPFPKDRLSFENSQQVLEIAKFVRDQAYAYVAKHEKAETPPSEEGFLQHPPENGHQMVPIQDIDSMGSKLNAEVNNEELQENHKRIITSTFPSSTGREKSEMNVAISSSQDLWLKRFLDSLPDPSPDHLDFPQLQE